MAKQIIIFDLHGTFTKSLDTQPKAATISDKEIVEDIQEPELMKEAILSALKNGHKIAFASFSDIKHATAEKPLAGEILIKTYLQTLFSTHPDIIDQIYIVSEEPQPTVDENGNSAFYLDKVEHQNKIVQYFKDLCPEETFAPEDVILIDNDYSNYYSHVTFGYLAIRADFEDHFQDNYHGHSMKNILKFICEFSSSKNLAQKLFEKFCYFQADKEIAMDLGMFQMRFSESLCNDITNDNIGPNAIRRLFPLFTQFTGIPKDNILKALVSSNHESFNKIAKEWAEKGKFQLPEKGSLQLQEKASPLFQLFSVFQSMQAAEKNTDDNNNDEIKFNEKMEVDEKEHKLG